MTPQRPTERGAAFPHQVRDPAAVGLNSKLYLIEGYVQG